VRVQVDEGWYRDHMETKGTGESPKDQYGVHTLRKNQAEEKQKIKKASRRKVESKKAVDGGRKKGVETIVVRRLKSRDDERTTANR
jgi:hypothetical protein